MMIKCRVSMFDCMCCDWDRSKITDHSTGDTHHGHRSVLLLSREHRSPVSVWPALLWWPASQDTQTRAVLSPIQSCLLWHRGSLSRGLQGHQATGAGVVGHCRSSGTLCWQCSCVSGVWRQGGWIISVSKVPGIIRDILSSGHHQSLSFSFLCVERSVRTREYTKQNVKYSPNLRRRLTFQTCQRSIQSTPQSLHSGRCWSSLTPILHTSIFAVESNNF